MKYKTTIQVICEASDREEALNIAGEYLRGDIDFGVDMQCQSISLAAHRVKKYAAACLAFFLVFAALLLKIEPVSMESGNTGKGFVALSNTFTVTPLLKTKHASAFKKEWEEKKHEAVIDFLKK